MSVSLNLQETTGSVGERDSIKSNNSSETTGSVSYLKLCNSPAPNITRALPRDTVSFCARDSYYEDEGASASGIAFGVASAAALAIIGLGYAHKTGAISKISHEGTKNFLNKIAEPCHNWCSKALNFAKDGIDKVKQFFNKK